MKTQSRGHSDHMNIDKEILLKEYELNMSDHDRKEKMAWLASTLYFTFCLVIISFILGNTNIKNIFNTLCDQQTFLVFVIVYTIFIIIFIFVFRFVNYQFINKERSYNKAIDLQKYFIKNILKNEDDKKFLYNEIYELHKSKKYIKSKDIPRKVTFQLLWLFFLIKLAITIVYFFNLIFFLK